MTDTHTFIESYFSDLADLMSRIPTDQVEELVDRLHDAWIHDRHVLLMGNGGSSSTVSHIVADLQKNIFLHAGRPLKTMCLTDSTPLLTAWANDTRYDHVFAAQIECWAREGDLVIAVSGSGNSPNIIYGIEAANRVGAYTYGLAGYQGGKLKDVARHCLIVPSDNMQKIEDVHMSILHAAFLAVVKRLPSTAA